MKFSLAFFVAVILALPAHAFQLRQHEIHISTGSTVDIPITNIQDNPILVRITPPENVQVFPRRIRLLPGQKQVLKARLKGGLPDTKDNRIAFSYAVENIQKRGSHARITLRIPVKELK